MAAAKKAIFNDKFKVKWNKVDIERLYVGTPEDRQIPGKDSAQKYAACAAEYMINEDLEGEDPPAYEDFRMEGPVLYSKYGISEMKDDKTGQLSFSIYAPLPVSKDPDAKAFVAKLDDIYERMSQYVEQYRVKLGRSTFKAEGAEAAGISKLYKYRKDKASGEFYTDRDPHIYNKLATGGEKTIFVGLDGAIIPWEKLKNVEMKFVPIYTLGLYKGGSVISYPFKVAEALVLFYRSSNASSSQLDTIESLKEAYMNEYLQSIQAMNEISTKDDGLVENKSTLGDVEDKAITHEEAQEEEELPATPPPQPATKKAPPRKGLKNAI